MEAAKKHIHWLELVVAGLTYKEKKALGSMMTKRDMEHSRVRRELRNVRQTLGRRDMKIHQLKLDIKNKKWSYNSTQKRKYVNQGYDQAVQNAKNGRPW
jgi:hypothetical protein